MKNYRRIIVFVLIGIVVLIAAYMVRRVSVPESGIIAKERARLSRTLDAPHTGASGAEREAVQEKLKLLGQRLAMAYNAENRPDDAIKVLQELIEAEQTVPADVERTARSYHNEAHYTEILAASYLLKHDPEKAEQAQSSRRELISRALDAKKREKGMDGKLLKPRED